MSLQAIVTSCGVQSWNTRPTKVLPSEIKVWRYFWELWCWWELGACAFPKGVMMCNCLRPSCSAGAPSQPTLQMLKDYFSWLGRGERSVQAGWCTISAGLSCALLYVCFSSCIAVTERSETAKNSCLLSSDWARRAGVTFICCSSPLPALPRVCFLRRGYWVFICFGGTQ